MSTDSLDSFLSIEYETGLHLATTAHNRIPPITSSHASGTLSSDRVEALLHGLNARLIDKKDKKLVKIHNFVPMQQTTTSASHCKIILSNKFTSLAAENLHDSPIHHHLGFQEQNQNTVSSKAFSITKTSINKTKNVQVNREKEWKMMK